MPPVHPQMPPEEILTPRLLLRRARVSDAETIFATYGRDPEVTRYLLFRPDQTLEEIRAFLEKTNDAWNQGKAVTWAITLKEGDLIGMLDLRLEAEGNLGYVLARPYWNRGLTTEAVRAVIAAAFRQGEIHRVWAVCEVNNTPSARVMEKAGMRLEGRLERHLVFPNLGEEPRDVYRYGISSEEWKEGLPAGVRSGSMHDEPFPTIAEDERLTTLHRDATFRIEKILSAGQTTPAGRWYDQETDEWVLLLEGRATIAFENGARKNLEPGEWIFIPRRCKHRVEATSSDPGCVWIGVHATLPPQS
jgi:ribosomal-protein-alanine N-acetyltransferase